MGHDNSAFEPVPSGYNYGNNNNDGKMSPNEMSDYDEPRQEYQWMKSNAANGWYFVSKYFSKTCLLENK